MSVDVQRLFVYLMYGKGTKSVEVSVVKKENNETKQEDVFFKFHCARSPTLLYARRTKFLGCQGFKFFSFLSCKTRADGDEAQAANDMIGCKRKAKELLNWDMLDDWIWWLLRN